MLPSFVLSFIFKLNYPASQSISYAGVMFIGSTWLLALISTAIMLYVGFYQFNNHMRLNGTLNVLFGIIFVVIFVLPFVVLLIFPPGVGNS
jgi:hypothetical protein